MNANNLKYVSLLTLTVQNSAVSLCMRYAKTRDGDIFYSSTGKTEFLLCSRFAILIYRSLLAVFCAELVKLLTCLVLVFMEEGTYLRFRASLYNAIVKNKADTVSQEEMLPTHQQAEQTLFTF